jgi:hypothetical protein
MRDMTDLKRCYERCFAGQAGQAVLEDLEARAFVHATSFAPDPQRAAFNEGRRSLALHIRRMLDRQTSERLTAHRLTMDREGAEPGAQFPEVGQASFGPPVPGGTLGEGAASLGRP